MPRECPSRLLSAPALVLPALLALACQQHPGAAEAVVAGAAGAAAASPWQRQAPPPGFDRTRPLQVGFLVVDGVYNSELMAPYDVFHHTVFHTTPDPGMELSTVSPDGGEVTTFEGLRIRPRYGFDDAPPLDVLVLPSAEHSMDTDLENARLIEWVRATGQRARFVVSLCDGAFVLAKAGLLDGHAVTTFPGDQDRFATTFPALDLRRNTSFVHDRNVLTSEGGARSYEVAMYLVDHLYGTEVARGIGAGLLIDWPPERSDATVVAAPES